MKILLLADINSEHTRKWATALVGEGAEVAIFSLSAPSGSWYVLPGIKFYSPLSFRKSFFNEGILLKLIFLTALPSLIKIVRSFKPEVIHAHYASSYGLLGALLNFSPFLISVWGSDIFDFPRKSFITKKILKFNLGRAGRILSTSLIMQKETEKYTSKPVIILPFGIDLSKFSPAEHERNDDEIVVGTIKSLEPVYGIDIIIKAFKIVKSQTNKSLRLLIIGDGSLMENLMKLSDDLSLNESVTFTGKVDYSEIPEWHRKIDVFVNASYHESFGVSVLEASASGVPVIVTSAGGLPEVVIDNETGFIVPPGDPEKTASALERLILNRELRTTMGKKGREFVKQKYDLEISVKKMLDVYEQVIVNAGKS